MKSFHLENLSMDQSLKTFYHKSIDCNTAISSFMLIILQKMMGQLIHLFQNMWMKSIQKLIILQMLNTISGSDKLVTDDDDVDGNTGITIKFTYDERKRDDDQEIIDDIYG